MTPADRRFIEYWGDQRKGSKVGYHVTYIIAWGVVMFFVLFFLSKFLTDLWKTGGPYLGLIFIVISLIFSFFITRRIWNRNEVRWHALLKERGEVDN